MHEPARYTAHLAMHPCKRAAVLPPSRGECPRSRSAECCATRSEESAKGVHDMRASVAPAELASCAEAGGAWACRPRDAAGTGRAGVQPGTGRSASAPGVLVGRGVDEGRVAHRAAAQLGGLVQHEGFVAGNALAGVHHGEGELALCAVHVGLVDRALALRQRPRGQGAGSHEL